LFRLILRCWYYHKTFFPFPRLGSTFCFSFLIFFYQLIAAFLTGFTLMICNMCLYKGTPFDEEFSLSISKSREDVAERPLLGVVSVAT
jgi:hypothetical protein